MIKLKMGIMQDALVRRLLIAVIIGVLVCTSIFFTFAQFNPDSLQRELVVHTPQADITYYEWDDAGFRYEREALFHEYGFFETLIGSDYMDQALDTINDDLKANEQIVEPVRHRLGYSFVLNQQIEFAMITLSNRADIPYVVFLDDNIIYSDFPGEIATWHVPPVGLKSITNSYNSGSSREISISLPIDYLGKTLTIIEYLSQEQAAFWYPMSPEITSAENERLEAIMSYGVQGVFGGMLAAVLIVFAALFIIQLLNGKQPYLLILPILFILIHMTEAVSFANMVSMSLWVKLQDLVVALSIYCAGDLLFIFLAFKMKHRLRFTLVGLATLSFLIASGYLFCKFLIGEDLSFDMPWLGAVSTIAFLYMVVLMIRESKSNPYFKHSGWLLLAGWSVYMIMLLIAFFTDKVMFIELYGPISAIYPFLSFYPFNRLLSTIIMMLITILSISEYVSMLMERQTRLTSLEQINRLKTEFLGNVSHEMRTPLTVASVNVQIVSGILNHMSETVLDPKIDDLLANAQSEIMRLSRMVGGMLTLASFSESTEKSKIDLSVILRSTANVLRMILLRRGNELEVEISGDLISFGDADLLSQVIVNLIQNAHAHTMSDIIRLQAFREGSKIIVKISDKGSGISEELLPHVFERGVSGEDGNIDGTGFGLFLCRTVVESHGGEIWIESKQNEGTVVQFTLPIYEGQYGGNVI